MHNSVIKSNSDYPQLSILITTHNRCNTLKRCLDSITVQDYPKSRLELIVLDDGSTDSTDKDIPAYLREFERKGFYNTLFFRNPENLGIAESRWILGHKASANSTLLLILDDDAYLESNCLKGLVTYMTEHPEVGIVGPRVVFADSPNLTAHAANFMNRWTGRYRNQDSSVPLSCDWLITVCILVRRQTLEKIGGSYPGYYTAHEEVDFCLRAKKAGFQVVYFPLVKVRHEEKLFQFKRERLYYLYRNKLILYRRNFPLIQRIVAISLVLFLGLPKYLFESVRYHKKIVFPEIRLIFIAVWHGLIGRDGKLI